MPHAVKTVSWFILVGCMAAATHWLVAVGCVESLHVAPLIANLIGWLTAVTVSFAGHYRLTFRHQVGEIWPAAWRFFIVSALGFLVNESAYAFLLKNTEVSYEILLFCVLVAVAALTFVLSRSWAFRNNSA
uniref:GtrA-like protein n=1 Tax=Dechloromonas aromatica (strain RCB) TaxID=159087 RepID=Q47CE4_DECAR